MWNDIRNGAVMVRHVIIWKIKEEYVGKAAEIKANAKKELEDLNGQIPGMWSLVIRTEGLPSSNGDLMLDGEYNSAEDLNAYSVHPKHVHVAGTFIRPYMQVRMCFDYEE